MLEESGEEVTATALATMLRARRTGKGKWTARCPSHADRNPSLSIAEGRKGVLIRCMSHGCETRDILDALGLTWKDLFADSTRPDPAILRQIREQQEKDDREQRSRKDLAYAALERAYDWDTASHEIARLLFSYPDDDRLCVLYHRSLDYARRCESIAKAYWLNEKTWGTGICANERRRWPTKLTLSDMGMEISGRLGLCEQ